MTRRTWALLLGIAVAVAAVVGGSLVAIGLGDDDAATPTGAANVLRLEPANEEFDCGGPAAVFVFLDDLVHRPSTLDAAASYGVSAFQLPLQYDPAIIRLGAPVDVQLNPQVDIEDSDDDGVVRNFLLLTDIDDFRGRSLVGASSYVPSSQGGTDNYEEGIDPVARGEPLLLMTLRFTAVNAGTAELRVEPWAEGRGRDEPAAVYDVDGNAYEPLEVKTTSITVRGDDCPEVATATPRLTPTRPATPVPTPTIFIPTAEPVGPTPAAGFGRSDCPEGWNVYRDPDDHFSFCYPPEWSAISSPPDGGLGKAISLSGGDYASATFYWHASSYFDEPGADRCRLAPAWEQSGQIEMAIAGRTVPACTGYETLAPEGAPPLRSTFAEVPVGQNAGYVVLFITRPEGASHAAERADATSVVESLILDQ